MLKVEMLSTGDEVLHGQIVDTNAAGWPIFLSSGVAIISPQYGGDNLDDLVTILRERSQHADVLIVNGGLGPTSDDLSALAAATAKVKARCCMKHGSKRWNAISTNVDE